MDDTITKTLHLHNTSAWPFVGALSEERPKRERIT